MRIKIVLFVVVFFISVACGRDNSSFTLNVKLDNCADSSVLYLNNTFEGYGIDTAYLVNGIAQLNGSVSTPCYVSLVCDANAVVDGQRETDFKKVYRINFYIENSQISVSADVNTLDSPWLDESIKTEPAIIMGSKTEDLNQEYLASVRSINDELAKVYASFSKEYYMPKYEGRPVNDSLAISLVKEEIALNTLKDKICNDFIYNNPKTVVAKDLAIMNFNDRSKPLTISNIDSVASALNKYWSHKPEFVNFASIVEKAKKMAIGATLDDVTLFNLNGEQVSLKEYIPQGKYVLLEFWASWCSPCRAEIPHLKHINKMYSGDDFAIVSVSVDDNDQAWKNAVLQEDMSWTQLRNPNGNKGGAVEEYGIDGVPFCVLLDKSGKVCNVNMRGPYLDAFVDTLK